MQKMSQNAAIKKAQIREGWGVKFRKKPVVIDAVKWDETRSTLNVLESMGMVKMGFEWHLDTPDHVKNLSIRTLEGSMQASKGDWIIRGVKGEFYPCKPDIFEATYEAAE
mgnify:CR=1 FL=1